MLPHEERVDDSTNKRTSDPVVPETAFEGPPESDAPRLAEPLHPARMLISGSRKPASYINNAKRFLAEHGEVKISALGTAIAPAVALAEILKQRGLAAEKHISTAMETLSDTRGARSKPKLEIVMTKSADFDSIAFREAQEGGQTAHGGELAVDPAAAAEGLRLYDDN